MADIYVPIDYSNARDVIPPGEEIIYSTLCKGRGEYLEGTKSITYDWTSHFLLTEKGVAFTIPLEVSHTKKEIKKLNPREEHYLAWHNIEVVPGRGGDKPGFIIEKIEKEIKIMCFMELVPIHEFESEDEFNIRKMLFFERFKPIQEQKKKEVQDKLYEYLKEHPDLNWYSEEGEKKILDIFGPIVNPVFFEVTQRINKERKAAKKAEKKRLKEEKKRQKAAKKSK